MVTALWACRANTQTEKRTIYVAAAANFTPALSRLKPAFEDQYPYTLSISGGSTGKLYTQIINGAPFDVFLSADQARVKKLVDLGLADAQSQMTYARGALVLIGAPSTDPRATLKGGAFSYIAMANPALAPYGVATQETLEAMGYGEQYKDRLVYGENVGQAFAFAQSGNAQLGFVSLAHVKIWQSHRANTMSAWRVPDTYHAPINQDGVILTVSETKSRAGNRAGADAFFEFLKSQEARDIILDLGYIAADGN